MPQPENRRGKKGSEPPDEPISLPETPESLPDLLKSLAVIAGLTVVLAVASALFGHKEKSTSSTEPNPANIERLLNSPSPDYALFESLWNRSAIPHEPYDTPQAQFAELRKRLSVVPESEGDFRQIMHLASDRLDLLRLQHKQVNPQIVFRAAASVFLLRELKSECANCTEESLKDIALGKSDQLIDSCLLSHESH